MSPHEGLDQRLARLAEQTTSLGPRREFLQRTMVAIQAEAALSFRFGLSRGARRFVPIALALALCAVSWAVVSEREATELVATSFGNLELEW
jgi:hypothetical protein